MMRLLRKRRMKADQSIMMKRQVFFLALLLLVCFMAFVLTEPVYAEDGEGDDPPDAYAELMALDDTPPTGFDSTEDPYGYGKDNPFFLVQMDDLMVYRHFGLKDEIITSYGRLKANNTESPLKDPGTTKDLKVSAANTLSFAQTVGFDPTGSGRKDHIAVLGVKEANDGNAHVILYVMDKDGTTSAPWVVGPAHWMTNSGLPVSDNMYDFNAMNFLAITAGDYNGDKKESLVIYACCDNPTLATFTVTVTGEGDGKNISLSPQAPNGKLIHHLYKNLPNEYIGNRLHCALDSGDLNGDGITDLAVLSYVGRTTRADNGREQNTQFYLPSLAASYGQKGTDPITAGVSKSRNVYLVDTNNGNEHITPMGAGLDVGDLTGDGIDEVTVAGFYRKLKGTYDKTVEDPYYDLDSSKLVVGVYNGNMDTMVYQTDIASNQWTRGNDANGGLWVNGPSSDDSFQQTAVESVAINGRGAAKHLFINGYLYILNTSSLTLECVYQPEFFQHADLATGSSYNYETYFRDTAVGVFDGNEDGYEQVVFVLGSFQGQGMVIYLTGMVGGVYEKDGVKSSTAIEYYSTSTEDIENSHYLSKEGRNCDYDCCFSYSLCAWDCNHDGLHVKYAGKDYAYSDPDVMAVLQAAPYFEDVEGTMNGKKITSYQFTTTYGKNMTDGGSWSWGVGVAVDAQVAVMKIHVDGGYLQNWTDKFSQNWTRSFTYTADAIGEDQVVVYRTPVIIYTYLVEKNGEWPEDNTISLAFPGEPSLSVMSVKDYNKLVECYNKANEDRAKEINKREGKTVIKDEDIPRLVCLEDPYLGHKGDPFSYMTSTNSPGTVKYLQGSANTFGVGSSSTGFTWKTDQSSTNTHSVSRGFNFNLTIQFGGSDQTKTYSFFGGAKTSLQYMKEHCTSKTEGNGEGISCIIGNMDPNHFDKEGLSEATARMYGFKYQLVAWPSNLINTARESKDDDDGESWFVNFGDGKNKYVPIFGYMLSSVKAGPPKVKDLTSQYEKDANGNRTIRLAWSDPSDENRKAAAFTLYRIHTDRDGTRILEKLKDLPAGTQEYLYTDLGDDQEFRFVMRTQSQEGGQEGVNSNENFLYIGDNDTYLISFESSDGETDTYLFTLADGSQSTFTMARGLSIQDVKIKVGAGTDKHMVSYVISLSDGSKETVNLRRNQSSGIDPSNAGTSDKTPSKGESQGNKTPAVLDRTSLKLAAGQTTRLTVSGGTVVKWTTSNKKLARVKGGKVTALNKGKVLITALLQDGSKLDCNVEVISGPVIRINGKNFKKNKRYTVKKGGILTIKIRGKAPGINNAYSSNNKKIARVTSKKKAKKLKIKGYRKGKTTIKIKVNDLVYKIKVQVK